MRLGTAYPDGDTEIEESGIGTLLLSYNFFFFNFSAIIILYPDGDAEIEESGIGTLLLSRLFVAAASGRALLELMLGGGSFQARSFTSANEMRGNNYWNS